MLHSLAQLFLETPWIMTKQLTERQKAKWINAIIDRDNFKCFYCKGSFGKNSYVFDHLNNIPSDNRFDNLVLAHQKCNVKKGFHAEHQVRAKDKLKENESKNFWVEWEREQKHSFLRTHHSHRKHNHSLQRHYAFKDKSSNWSTGTMRGVSTPPTSTMA